MGRRKYEVNDETAYRWSERYRRGDSFRKIALDEKVERRLVARVVRNLDRQKHLEEGAATRREIRAGFLKKHLQDLQMAAKSLLEITAPPSLQGSMCVNYSEPDSELVQRMRIELYLQTMADTADTAEVGLIFTRDEASQAEQRLRLQLRLHMAERETKAIIADLKEHLPQLPGLLKQWHQVATEYAETWRTLAKQAHDMGTVRELFESGLRAGLESMSKFKEEENLPPLPRKLETASNVGQWLFQNYATRECLELFPERLENLEAIYAQLEEMLSPFELRKTLLGRQCKHCPLP